YQLAITVGILAAYLSNALFLSIGAAWFSGEIWRPMFLVMAVPSVIFLLLLLKVPESPRWLISVQQDGKARAILESIRTADVAAKEMADMQAAAKRTEAHKPSLLEGPMRLPLFIGIVLA